VDVFSLADRSRRLAGAWLDAVGLGPIETPGRRVHTGRGFELIGYASPRDGGPAVLLVPAPIKRAYIWDLAPRASVVRRCLEHRLRPYLLRWTESRERDRDLGLAAHADEIIAQALTALEAETGERRTAVAGHSLGGTLAALFASTRPERMRGLVLLEAPLAFEGAAAGPFAPLVAAAPPARSVTRTLPTVPGTFLDVVSVTAAPDVFVWHRWLDGVLSLRDPGAVLLHARVERWMLDEFPLGGRLFEDVLELLYREDRFMRGTLRLGRREARPDRVRAPILAVVDPCSRLVPGASVRPFLDAAGTRDTTLLEYDGDTGVSLQHVGVLVGSAAHQRLWPRILNWIARLP
jgi:polyhydroxyalkanoate synthase